MGLLKVEPNSVLNRILLVPATLPSDNDERWVLLYDKAWGRTAVSAS